MPVLPNPTELPSASQKGNESQDKPDKQCQKASAVDHVSKGPQIPDNMPPKASREEIEARMKDLNKSK